MKDSDGRLLFTLRGPKDDMKPDEALAHAQRLVGVAMECDERLDPDGAGSSLVCELLDLALAYLGRVEPAVCPTVPSSTDAGVVDLNARRGRGQEGA